VTSPNKRKNPTAIGDYSPKVVGFIILVKLRQRLPAEAAIQMKMAPAFTDAVFSS